MSPPDLLALHQYKPDDYPYLLASNTSGAVNTRYSILMAYPQQTIVQNPGDEDCLSTIHTPLTSNPEPKEYPFIGGWFVFLSYEYASIVEPSVNFHIGKSSLPLAFISRIPAAVIIDHQLHQGIVVASSEREDLIQQILCDIESAPAFEKKILPACEIDEEDPAVYLKNLEQIHQYIKNGDVFQANLSRLWSAKFERNCDPVSLYANLRHSNPAPFASLVKFKDQYIISSSPERLVSVCDGTVDTRPIAGTYPRGKTAEEDKQLSDSLLNHPKERAEHVMLIDLERNDLGRICSPGSIHVKDKMIVETYTHVHHIVSRVSGQLKDALSTRDVVHAVFPGGTITGCPKVRCMQIISELEQTARGAYTGALGYVSDNGFMDLNILIRTMAYGDNVIQFRAGAGIVSDSVSEKELTETRHKARGMLNALQFNQ
ncbi:MAG: aminodeoxychorismate synthase component I [Gammaproteobacteria bacterium]|nr:aminodeoxychorismate synthase component I [Gammaproteobacteria bacterium]